MQTKLNPIKYLSSKLPQFARATKKKKIGKVKNTVDPHMYIFIRIRKVCV